MANDNEKMSEEESLSRRRFLKNSGIAVGGLAVGGVVGGMIPWRTKEQPGQQTKNQKSTKPEPGIDVLLPR
ncbi:twin-arginine translocation signal domain-containing protein [Virgibacillus halophilus]|uniref:Twin-arginine translocation signal domain-containing protein n=1 Tax=Tigheibacillus halophilus TaxID=361280 RepID=A0ABU5CA43_9BACI|nr:twin-arginine translocation signal domain-containing protein [Virgibacillus halophilus]